MKKSTSNYLEISNRTKSCIVINSCNIILKPKGESGSSIIVEKSKTMDNSVVGLQSNGLIEISIPKIKKEKKQKNNNVATKENNASMGDKKGSKVTYVDRGKVKTGKMTTTVQDLHMIDPNGNGENKDADTDEDKPSEAFVDPK